MYFKKIEGKKVYLSPMCVEDAEKYVKWMNDFLVEKLGLYEKVAGFLDAAAFHFIINVPTTDALEVK